MEYSKPFLSYEAQIELLEKRGLLISDRKYLRERLANVGYYRLSAYWFPFKMQGSDNFRTGTTFDQIYRRYRFDRRFKTLIFDAIERVETAIKARVVYELAQQYGPFGYLIRCRE